MKRLMSVGVLLIVGLAWIIVRALLTALGVSPGASSVVGFVLLFLFGPLVFGLAGGGTSSHAGADGEEKP